MKKRTMIKIILLLTLTVSICACNNKHGVTTRPNKDNAQTASTEPASKEITTETETTGEVVTEKETESETQSEDANNSYQRKYLFSVRDELLEVYISDKLVASYAYNSDRHVSCKISDGKYTEFTYDDNGMDVYRITYIDYNGEYDITYVYEEVQVSHPPGYIYDLVGFVCNDVRYNFIKEYDTIIGISDSEGNQIVKYDYTVYKEGSVSGRVPITKSFDGTEWIINEEADFIGNINRVFKNTHYYDREAGLWMSMGDFNNPVTGNDISGLSFENGRVSRSEIMVE